MSHPFAEFGEIVSSDAQLASLTWLRLGGPAQYLARPRNINELKGLVELADRQSIPCRILAGGFNVLVRDQGVNGLVIHLVSPAFSDIQIHSNIVEAEAAVPLTALISQTARAGLAGLEHLTGVPGTIGGAVKSAASARSVSLEPLIQSISLLDADHDLVTLQREDLAPGHSWADMVDNDIILRVSLKLSPDDPEVVVKRMRNVWILKKENQPYGHQPSACIFRDPRPDMPAETFIEEAGMRGSRIGGAEISMRNANYIVAEPGCTPSDILKLIDLVKGEVERRCKVELELRLEVW